MALPEAQLCRNEEYDFTQIPGCVLWLSPSSVEIVSGKIRTLYDKSTSGYHATQLTTSKQATYVAAHPNFNNKPVIDFTTKLLYYERTGGLPLMPFRNDPFTFVWVANREAVPEPNSDNFIFSLFGSAGNGHLTTGTDFDGYMKNFYGVTASLPAFRHLPASQPCIYMVSFTPILVSFWRNGKMEPTSPHNDESFVNRTGTAFFRVGTDSENATPGLFDDGYNGRVADLLMWNRDLSLSEKARVFMELAAYYNIPGVCP